MSFNQFIMKEQYEKIKGLGDRLELMKQQIKWEPFIPLVRSIFRDDKKTGGRPHTDELVVVRAMLIQAWYGLTDPDLEYQCHDRISFRNFLGFPETIPDFTTIWKIRERLKNAGIDKKIWGELQKQIQKKGYLLKKGVIQDATFIQADTGRKRQNKEKQAKKKGKKIEYTEKQKRHMDQDGSYAVKRDTVYYGYKNHIKVCVANGLIRGYNVTTASTHDSQVDLIKRGDRIAYRDKGYFGKPINLPVRDMTMKRAPRGKKQNIQVKLRNQRISKIRSPGERPFAVIKRIFNGTHTFVKKLKRVHIKEMFKNFAYNMYQLVTLQRHQLATAIQNT